MRRLDEFLNPSLKCARLGHRPQYERRSGMRKAKWEERWNTVCMSIKQQRCICSRCTAVIEEPREISARSIGSWSAPQSIWDEFHEKGEWFSGGWEYAPPAQERE